MNFSIPYEEAKRLYPKQVKDIMFKLRESSSKNKNVKEKELKWSLDWCVKCQGGMTGLEFVELLKKGKLPERKPDPDSFEDYWADLEPRIIIHFFGKVGRWRKCSDKKFPVPERVKDYYRQEWDRQQKEKERIAALTPEEKDAEVKETLRQLSGYNGFTAIKRK